MKSSSYVWFIGVVAMLLVSCGASGGEAEPPSPTPVPPTSTPAATPTRSAGEYVERGMEYAEQGAYEDAIIEFEKAIALDPDDAEAHRNLGTAYGEQGRWEESAAAYERAVEIDPTFGEAYGDLAGAYFYQGKIPEALEAGERAVERAPDYATAYNNLGIVHGSQGEIDEAIALFEKAIELDPNDGNAHYNLGFAYENLERLDEAVAAYQEAVQVDPNYLDAYENLGTVYARQGQLEEAIVQFETFLELAPPDDPGREQVEGWLAELRRATAEAGTEYANVANGYRLTYPAGWYYIEDGNRTSFAPSQEAYQASTLESPLITIFLTPLAQTAAGFGLDVGAGPAEFLEVMTARIGAEVEGMEGLQVAGYPAAVAATSGTVLDSPYSGHMLIVLVEERTFLIEAIAPPDQWGDFRPTFVEMVNSLAFFEPGD